MKHRTKRLLSLALTLVFALGAIPCAALTAGAEPPYSVGEIIEFGGYPQTRVTDEATVTALNAKVKDSDWVSYGYYSGNGRSGSMRQGDWMKYCDIFLGGAKYRGVSFTKYRPRNTIGSNPSAGSNTNQDDNGYEPGVNYWFLWESLRWRILDPEAGLVISEYAIDSQAYNDTLYGQYYSDPDSTLYVFDYKTSSIRQWLSETFYNTAFTASQQDQIALTRNENRSGSTLLTSEPTDDKIYMLSYNEAVTEAYGMRLSDERMTGATDYAKAQGAYIGSGTGTAGWMLRDGAGAANNYAVNSDGLVHNNCTTHYTGCASRPAFKFKSGIVFSPYSVGCEHTGTVFVNNGDGTHTERCATCDLPLGEPAAHRMGQNKQTDANGHFTDCPDCGVSFTYAHDDKGAVETVAGTCVTPGQKKYRCSVMSCPYFGRTEETSTDASNHEGPYTYQDAVAATCSASGSTPGKYCTACGEWEIAPRAVDPDPANHVNTEEFPETASYCYRPGYTAGVYCGDCERWISGHEEKQLAEHSWAEVARVKATCQKAGYVDFACSVKSCGATKREILPVDPDAHDLRTTVVDPTCTDEGYTSHNCALCRYGYNDEITPALGHKWSEPEWKWTGTTGAEATFTCANGDHPRTVNAAVTAEVVKEPTDIGKGLRVFTATVKFEGGTYVDTVEQTIPALNDRLCKWCGELHEGFLGSIVGFFHSIMYFFAHLFGQR